jgi:hypothetical protein
MVDAPTAPPKREVRGSMPRPTTHGVLTRAPAPSDVDFASQDLASPKREVTRSPATSSLATVPLANSADRRAHNVPTRNWNEC